MLNGIRVYSADTFWRNILKDLGATVLDAPNTTGLNFDSLHIVMPISPMQLKSALLDAADYTNIIRKIFGKDIQLSSLHARIVVQLYKSGGMNAAELKSALGYSTDTTTHTVDTAIYQLRKLFGHDFIINENGVYRIGKL
ncbi:MAG: hypothetical protein J5679_01665 [Alphaproteobacteria bacterium]|nr:hypothetical protein [Alphaproteobacteria bacterium]